MVSIFGYIASGLTERLTVRSEDRGQETSSLLAGVLVKAECPLKVLGRMDLVRLLESFLL